MGGLFIIIPLLAVVILNLPFRALMKTAAFWLLGLLCLAQIYLVIHPGDLWQPVQKALDGFFILHLDTDELSLTFLLCIPLVMLMASMVGRAMIPEGEKRFNFLNLCLIILAGMNGLVLVRDIFSLYVFMEVTAVVSYILIALHKDRDAFEGAFKYIVLSSLATVLMLSGIALMILMAGDTSFLAINGAFRNSQHSWLLLFAMGIFLSGVFIKAGIVPFAGWLPDAYTAAPAAASVLLAGIVTKTIGLYTVMRVVISVFEFTAPLQNVLMSLGAISILAGAFAAQGQTDLKRMLAYSSVSQVGYIVLGLGCASPLAVSAAIFHMFNHAVFKSLLFINAAAVEAQTGSRDMEDMGGLSSVMPVTGISSLIASLSAAGMPPFSGFWSKLLIIIALWVSGHYIYAALAAGAGVVTLSYLLRLQRKVFWGTLNKKQSAVKEAAFGLLLPMLILSMILVGVGICFPFIVNTFILPLSRIY